jgi:hypothetical protein
MNRLQKFIEQGASGEKPGRIAYAFGPSNLPEAGKGLEWKSVSPFSAADEVMAEPGLKEVFQAAVRDGLAVLEPRSTKT